MKTSFSTAGVATDVRICLHTIRSGQAC